MLRNRFLTPLFILSFLAVGGLSVFGQTLPISGKVELKKSETETVPLAGARVDCYRTDTSSTCRSTETNSKGEFVIAGIPYNATVVLAVSGTGVGPVFYPNIKPGNDKIAILVAEGNGEILTEAQVREQVALYAANPTGELTEDQKKAQAELEKKREEIIAKNAKIEAKNTLIERVLKEGNDAFNNADFDVAVAKYDEGIEADPDFIGSAPILLNNKGAALRAKGVSTYNAAVNTKNNAEINRGKASASKDLAESLSSYQRAYNILNGASAADIRDPARHKEDKFKALDGARDAIRIMVLIKAVDGSLTDSARKMTAAYVEIELNKDKQAQAQAAMAAYLFEGGDFDGSVAEYRKAYQFSPGDPDVLAKFSLALFTVAEDKQDKQMKQESLNYMEVYLVNAPKDHILRADIAGLADYLKTNEKLKPQKIN